MLDFEKIRKKELSELETSELRAYFAFLSLLPGECFQSEDGTLDTAEFENCAQQFRNRTLDATDLVVKAVSSTAKTLDLEQELQVQYTQRSLEQLFPEQVEALFELTKASELEKEAKDQEKQQKALDREKRRELKAAQELLPKEKKSRRKSQDSATPDFVQLSLFDESSSIHPESAESESILSISTRRAKSI